MPATICVREVALRGQRLGPRQRFANKGVAVSTRIKETEMTVVRDMDEDSVD